MKRSSGARCMCCGEIAMDAVEFEADVPANPLLGGGETATERVTIVVCAMCLSRASDVSRNA